MPRRHLGARARAQPPLLRSRPGGNGHVAPQSPGQRLRLRYVSACAASGLFPWQFAGRVAPHTPHATPTHPHSLAPAPHRPFAGTPAPRIVCLGPG
jgi:hypothetical protein